MIDLKDRGVEEYLSECRERLDSVGTDLLAIEKGGAEIDEALVDSASQAVHSLEGGAGLFDLAKIGELAHRLESVLELIRSRKLVPTPDCVRILLSAVDRLYEMAATPGAGSQANITEVMAALAALLPADNAVSADKVSAPHLRILVVEDDFASRLLLQTFLSRYGECHIAVNGKEAVEAVRSSLEQAQRYDLICMDIMLPEVDGREAVRQIRELEEAAGILSSRGVKIVMTTAVSDIKEVFRSFKELCDAYLVKPIDLSELLKIMKDYQLV